MGSWLEDFLSNASSTLDSGVLSTSQPDYVGTAGTVAETATSAATAAYSAAKGLPLPFRLPLVVGEAGLNSLVWADEYLLSRPASTLLQAANPANPLYRDGLSLDDFSRMWDASKVISPGRAATTAQGDLNNLLAMNPAWNAGANAGADFAYSNGYDPYSMTDGELNDKWDSSPLGRFSSGANDFAFQWVAGGKGVDAAALGLRRLAGLDTTIRSARDLSALRTDLDQHVRWLETGGAEGRRSVLGKHIEDMANTTDPYDIYSNSMIGARSKPGSVRQKDVADLISQVDDPRIVADLVLADKGDPVAIGRLLQSNPDYAWTLAGMNDALKSQFIVGGQYHPGVDEAARIASTFDKSIERDRWYQQMLDTFFVKEPTNPDVVGEVAGKYVSTAVNSRTVAMQGPAGRVQAWLSKQAAAMQVGEAGQWLEKTIGVPGRTPVTTFLHWVGSRKPLNSISLSGVRPTETVDEFLAYSSSVRVMRGNRQVQVTRIAPDGSASRVEMTAPQWRREAMMRLAQAERGGGPSLANEVRALEAEMLSSILHQYNVSPQEAEKVVKGLQDLRDAAQAQVARDGFWVDNAERIIPDIVTHRQATQDILLLPMDQIDWVIRKMSNADFAKQGRGLGKVQEGSELVLDQVYKWFRTMFLFKPGYVPKNSFAEPAVASLLAHGTVLSPDGPAATMSRFFRNRARGLRQAGYAIADRTPVLSRTRADEARLMELHQRRMTLQSELDNVSAWMDTLDSAGTSPAMRDRFLRQSVDDRARLGKDLRELNAYLDGSDPLWRQFETTPSYAELSQGVKDLELILSGDLAKAGDLRLAIARIEDRAARRTTSSLGAIDGQIARLQDQLRSVEAKREQLSRSYETDEVVGSVPLRGGPAEVRRMPAEGRDQQGIALGRQVESLRGQIGRLLEQRAKYEAADGPVPVLYHPGEQSEIDRLRRLADAIERWSDEGAAAVAEPGVPRIMVRDSHYGEERGWGSERIPFYVDETGAKKFLNDPRVDRRELPETLWHVTTNAGAVGRDGMLLASDGTRAGLGGASHVGTVSFTTSRETALLIRDDMRLYATLKDARSVDEMLRILQQDAARRGMSEKQFADFSDRVRNARGDEYSPAISDTVFSEYTYTRAEATRQAGAQVEPPILMGGYWKQDSPWWGISPDDIDIVMVPRRNIPQDALITDVGYLRRGEHGEVRVHADVPIGTRQVFPTPPRRDGRIDPQAALARLQTRMSELRDRMREMDPNAPRTKEKIQADIDKILAEVAGIQPRIAKRQVAREKARRRDLGGEKDFKLNVNGTVIVQEGTFSPTKYGTAMRAEASADRTATQSWNPASYVESKTLDWARQGDVVPIQPTDPTYWDELAHIANRQVRGDHFAVRVLRGDSDKELAEWSASPQGIAYWRGMGFSQADLMPQVVGTKPVKRLYEEGRAPVSKDMPGRQRKPRLPEVERPTGQFEGATDMAPGRPEVMFWESSPLTKRKNLILNYFPDPALRRRVVTGDDITAGELRSTLGARTDLQAVHGADFAYQGGGWQKVNRAINNGLNTVWRGLAATPESRFGRWPFVDRQFRMNLRSDLAYLQSLGVKVDVKVANALRQGAYARALKEAEQTFYNIRRYSNPVYALRYVIGFPGAYFNSMYRYMRLGYLNPGKAMVVANAWTSSYKSIGVDKDGNETDDWSKVESVVMPVPKAIQDRFPVNDNVKFSLRGWEFLTTPPASTPIVTFPVSMMIKQRPTVDDWIKQNMGEDFYQLLYPYGRPGTDSTVALGPLAADSFLPPYLLSAVTAFNKFDEDAVQTADMIYAYRWFEWERNGYQGPAPNPEDAAKDSTMFWGLKAFTQFMVPGGMQFNPAGQFYRDEWRKIIEAYPNDQETQKKVFLSMYGTPAEVFTMSTSKNRTGMPYTQDAYKVLQDNSDLVKKLREMNPDDPTATVSLLFGDRAGEFSQAVYDAVAGQSMPGETQSIRSKKTPYELRDEIMRTRSWQEYSKAVAVRDATMQQYGFKSLSAQGPSSTLYVQWNTWLAGFKSDPANTQWLADYQQSDSGVSFRVLTGLQAVTSDRSFMDANGGQSAYQVATEYLAERDRAMEFYAQQTTTEGREAIARQWDQYVQLTYLARSSVFAGWYVRYLDGGRDLANRRVFE